MKNKEIKYLKDMSDIFSELLGINKLEFVNFGGKQKLPISKLNVNNYLQTSTNTNSLKLMIQLVNEHFNSYKVSP